MKTLRTGFTTIKITKQKVTIEHAGNMGNTILRSVKPNVDALLGEGAFDKLKVNILEETGYPDYFYVLKTKNVL